jgi:glycosyltransferase involved in cell wall biosynthesis
MKLLLDWYLFNFRRSLASALREAGHEVLLLSPPGPHVERLRALGFDWREAPMDRRSLNPMREVALLFWLYRLLRAERPDVIHSFTIKCVVYGALAGRLARVSRVNAVAGMGHVFTSDQLRARLLRPLVSFLMRAALGGDRALLILQNPDDINLFLGAGLAPQARIRLIPGSGVDIARFRPPTEPRPPGKPPLVLVASRLLWDKGLREFVEAARALTAEGRNVRFALAGTPDPGNPTAVPEETLLEWRDSGVVEWLGYVADMPALFAEAEIVVLPSYREGLPKGLIEAAACARALVATDVPGCREVIRDGVDGLLVPAGESEPLARAIARLLDDPALARRLGEAARAKALVEFDERKINEATLAVYREVAPPSAVG